MSNCNQTDQPKPVLSVNINIRLISDCSSFMGCDALLRFSLVNVVGLSLDSPVQYCIVVEIVIFFSHIGAKLKPAFTNAVQANCE